MGWITPTTTKLKTAYLTADDATAITRASKATEDDPLAGALAQAVARVRGMVAQKTTVDDTAGTVPPECEHEVYVLARHTAIARFPALAGLLTEARKKEHEDAIARLGRIESGRITVTAAGADAPVPATPEAAVLQKPSTRHSRRGLDGIL